MLGFTYLKRILHLDINNSFAITKQPHQRHEQKVTSRDIEVARGLII
jgi:hypothetical protein